MKISIIGTGAVGGYFGAKLVEAGLDVTFIGSKESVPIIKEKGFHIKSPKGDMKIEKPNIFYELENIKESDIVLLCTKAYDTKGIAKALKDKISDKTLVISLQNGIDNEEILADILGEERVIAASIYLSAASISPGKITHAGSGKIILGELNKQITTRLKQLEELFLNAKIPCSVSTDLKKDMWKKLLVNSAYNGFTALIGKSLKDIHSVEKAKKAYLDVLKEGQAIAQAEGIEISDEEIEKLFEMLNQDVFINFKSSTLQDLEKGKKLEIDSIQGEIVRIAEKHGLKAPLNNLMYSLLKLKEA